MDFRPLLKVLPLFINLRCIKGKPVISREFRPLSASPPPHTKNCCIWLRSRASLSISALGGRRGPTAFAPFTLYQSTGKYIREKYNAARGLISRDIDGKPV